MCIWSTTLKDLHVHYMVHGNFFFLKKNVLACPLKLNVYLAEVSTLILCQLQIK